MKLKVIHPVPALDKAFAEATEAYLREAALPDTELEFIYVKKGYLSIETAAQDIINGAEVVKLVMDLQEDDCDGIFINCFDDPALIAAREVSKKPVLGPYGSSVSLAGLLGEKVGIITTDEYGITCEERKARDYGFENRIAAVKPVDLTVLDLHDNELIQRLVQCCMEFEKERITTVVLGCTGMNRAADKAQEELKRQGSGVQIVEPLRAGIKTLEMMVSMKYTNAIKCTQIKKEDYVEEKKQGETLYEKDIINVMNGAALLAAGGGGCFDDGMLLLNMFKEKHPDKPIEVKLCSFADMEIDECTAVVAGMGAPTEGAGKDFTMCAVHSFEEAQRMAAASGKNVKYTMPVEMGAFNTFAPMLISLMNGMPTLDADAAGRAVPGLDTLLAHINGGNTSPLAMSDENGNIVQIKCADPKDAVTAQNLASPIAVKFQSNAGIAGWVMSKNEIMEYVPIGTITLAKKIGEVIAQLRENQGEETYIDDLFDELNKRGIVEARTLHFHTKIHDFTTDFKDGFDVGSYLIGDETGGFNPAYKILFQNENLLLYRIEADGRHVLKMTAPDIITMYNARTGVPLTNEDLFLLRDAGKLDELEVVLGVIKADHRWHNSGIKMEAAWQPYFAALDYYGRVKRYEDLSKE